MNGNGEPHRPELTEAAETFAADVDEQSAQLRKVCTDLYVSMTLLGDVGAALHVDDDQPPSAAALAKYPKIHNDILRMTAGIEALSRHFVGNVLELRRDLLRAMYRLDQKLPEEIRGQVEVIENPDAPPMSGSPI